MTRVVISISILLCVLSFLSVFLTQNHYGPHWDAHVYYGPAYRFGSWVHSLTSGENVPSLSNVSYYFSWNRDHPPLAKILMGITEGLFRNVLGSPDAARLAVIICFSLLVVSVFAFCEKELGLLPALFAALCFWFMPRVFCHAHLIALDLFAAFFVFLAAILFHLYGQKRWGWIVGGFVIGIALLTKLQGFFVPLILGIWLAWEAVIKKRKEEKFAWKPWMNLVLAGLLSVIVFIIGWPYLWQDLAGNLKTYFELLLVRKDLDVFYFGKTLAGWHYPFVMFLITTPIAILLFGIIGLVRAFGKAASPFSRLMVCGFMFPLLILAMPGAKRYDGIRLFLPSLPFFACLCGVGTKSVLDEIRVKTSSERTRKRLSLPLVFIFPLLALGEIVAYHPHEIVYYNTLIGGFRGAYKRGLDADYLGLCVNKAWPILNKTLPDGAFLFLAGTNTAPYYSDIGRAGPGEDPQAFLKRTVRVTSLSLTDYFLRSDRGMFTLVNNRRGGLGEKGEKIVETEQPIWTYAFHGVPLLRLYRYPGSAAFPAKTFHALPYLDVLSVEQKEETGFRDEGVPKHPPAVEVTIVWRLRERAPSLGLQIRYEDSSRKRGGRLHSVPQVCRVWPTEMMYPGDVFRVSYKLDCDTKDSAAVFTLLDNRNAEVLGEFSVSEQD